MSEVTQLNLDGPIDREQYTHAVSHMVEFMEGELTHRHGWCSDRWRYFRSIVPEFSSIMHNHVNFEHVAQDADYPQLLKDMRARLLWYASDSGGPMIRLTEVNEILEHGGLPQYETNKTAGGIRVMVTLPDLELTVAGDDEREAANWVQQNLHTFVAAAMDGKVPDDAPYVPGSVVFDEDDEPSVSIKHDHVAIRVEDTLRPISARGLSSTDF